MQSIEVEKFDLDKQIEWSELRQKWEKSRKINVSFIKNFLRIILNWNDYMRLADYGSRIISDYNIPYKMPKGFENKDEH